MSLIWGVPYLLIKVADGGFPASVAGAGKGRARPGRAAPRMAAGGDASVQPVLFP